MTKSDCANRGGRSTYPGRVTRRGPVTSLAPYHARPVESPRFPLQALALEIERTGWAWQPVLDTCSEL